MLVAAAAFGSVAVGLAPTAASSAAGVRAAADESGAVAAFYRSRGGAPLWFAPRSGAAAQQLVQLLATSSADNLDPRRYQAQRRARAVQAAQSGNPAAVQQAEAMLSTAFVQYVRDLKHDPGMGIIYVDSELRPTPPSAATIRDRSWCCTTRPGWRASLSR